MINRLIEALSRSKKLLATENILAFTCDVDWASEYVIGESLKFAESYGIPLTVFMTHPSDILQTALLNGKIQVGLHPNFMPDSSQGPTIDTVIDYCFALYPQAECYRSHRYYDVNDVTDKMPKRGILYDSNVGTMLDDVFPFLHRSGIVRFPVFFEDGAYLLHNMELSLSTLENRIFKPGVRIINFHPMHLMLNTPYFQYTRDVKDKLSRDEWNNLGKEEISKISWGGGEV